MRPKDMHVWRSMSRVLGVRSFVLWHFSLALLALLCSALPATRKATIATPPTETKSSRAEGTSAGDDIRSESEEGDDEDRISELWLDDFDVELGQGDDEDAMLSDYPQMLGDEASRFDAGKETEDDAPTCPPPPNSLPTFACSVDQCESDKNCSAETLCCYNGCLYTCMTPVQPPPYVDWKRQPQSRLVAGSSWLVQGPSEEEEVEWCSTSAKMFGSDEDPLLCPHGYVCHVDDPAAAAAAAAGDPDAPNIGRCIQQFTVDKQKDVSEGKKVDCPVGQKRYPNGSSFEYNQHNCFCENGSVLCRVGRTQLKKTIKSPTRTRN